MLKFGQAQQNSILANRQDAFLPELAMHILRKLADEDLPTEDSIDAIALEVRDLCFTCGVTQKKHIFQIAEVCLAREPGARLDNFERHILSRHGFSEAYRVREFMAQSGTEKRRTLIELD